MMAYMTKDGKGPYPCYAGEHCGNHNPAWPVTRSFDESQGQAEEHRRQWLARMRFGLPRPCSGKTSAERAAEGWVGLYLKQDDKFHNPGDVLVDTPDELREPNLTEGDD